MLDVEITYPTRMGRLTCRMTTSQRVATRPEAEELRNAIKAIPELANATVKIKNAPPPPTVDEALDRIRAELIRFPAMK